VTSFELTPLALLPLLRSRLGDEEANKAMIMNGQKQASIKNMRGLASSISMPRFLDLEGETILLSGGVVCF
jgi:hypothetical protein